MYKKWVKGTLYMVAGAVRSFDHEWDVDCAKPVLDRFGELVVDGRFSDEDAGEICKAMAVTEDVGEGLRKSLMIAAWALENPWVNFDYSIEKYMGIFKDLEKFWTDKKFSTKELATWLERIADTIVV